MKRMSAGSGVAFHRMDVSDVIERNCVDCDVCANGSGSGPRRPATRGANAPSLEATVESRTRVASAGCGRGTDTRPHSAVVRDAAKMFNVDTATAARVCHRSSFHRVFELPQIGVRLDVTQPNNHYSGRRNSAGGRAVAPPAHAIACDHLRDTRGQLRVSALTRVPDALFRSNPYLMHLKDKATPQDNREGDLSPAELELLRSWDSFLELCGEPNGLSETELKALFVSFVARGGKVDDPSSPEALAVMTDVPPPSGTAYGPAPPTPKMKLSAREKVEFVEDLVQCHSARGHSAQSPRRDVKDTRTQNEALRHLTQQETARCQQQQINTLRAQERRLRFTANLYRRHNVKLTQPLLERRTIAEEEFTQQGTVASCGLRSSA